ncbi:hypothetical protein [Deinococcus apachensis]|uniref:hypothetical protein n=1 Tax=Deinococcus apachensis TaxID=309886 RepID=UPI000379F0F2|nr:hypothetical protein [Deinococcus apachensis]
MRHLIFPSKEQADAFIEDLRAQGVIQPEVGQTTLNRRMAETQTTQTTTTVDGQTAAEEAGEGAIEGTGVGAAVGTVAGVASAAAALATGGLAVPVILGMAALGSGVGAAVGAIGGAAEANADGASDGSYVEDHRYDQINEGVGGGRAVAVEDNIPSDVVEAAASRHGGQFV